MRVPSGQDGVKEIISTLPPETDFKNWDKHTRNSDSEDMGHQSTKDSELPRDGKQQGSPDNLPGLLPGENLRNSVEQSPWVWRQEWVSGMGQGNESLQGRVVQRAEMCRAEPHRPKAFSWSVHTFEETTRGWRKTHLPRLGGTISGAHQWPGTVPDPLARGNLIAHKSSGQEEGQSPPELRATPDKVHLN